MWWFLLWLLVCRVNRILKPSICWNKIKQTFVLLQSCFFFFCQPEAWASHWSYWEAFQCSTMLRATLVSACNRLIWPAVCDGLLTFAGKSQEYHVSRKLTDSICNINRYFAVPGWNWLLMHFIYKERDICLRSTNTVALEIILSAESKGSNFKMFGTP